jgi:hypothetical protein
MNNGVRRTESESWKREAVSVGREKDSSGY